MVPASARNSERIGAVARVRLNHIAASSTRTEIAATCQPRSSQYAMNHGNAAASASTGSKRKNSANVKERFRIRKFIPR